MSEYPEVGQDGQSFVHATEAEAQEWDYVDPMAGSNEEVDENGLAYFQGEDGYWYAYDPNTQEEEEYNTKEEEEEAISAQTVAVDVKEAIPLVENETNETNEVNAAQPEAKAVSSDVAPLTAYQDQSFILEEWIEVFFLSSFFRVYLSLLLYCAAVIIISLSVEYTFAALLRLFSPPSPKKNGSMEAFTYLAIFFFWSFIVVSVLGVLLDMIKHLWLQKRHDQSFWGMRNTFFFEGKAPVVIYGLIIISTLLLPFFWSFIEAFTAKQSVVFVFQRYFNVGVLAAVFLVAICYIYFYCRAVVFKSRALDESGVRDDFSLRERAYKKEPVKMTKKHWYHASTVLEEFGFDRDTLFYNTVVFIIGLTPLLGVYTAQTMCTFIGDPQVTWGLVSSIGVSILFFLSWLSRLDQKGQWSAYLAAFLSCTLLILGIAGAAMSSKPGSAAVVAVLFVISQGMFTRKRLHVLTRKELALLNPESPLIDHDLKREQTECDTYLCCCKPVLKEFMSCFWKSNNVYPHRSRENVEADRLYAQKKLALRTDQKILLIWWVAMLVLVAGAVGLGNAVQYNFTTAVASIGTTRDPSKTGMSSSTPHPLCGLAFNMESSSPFSVLDLAFLAMLSYTYGSNGDVDFATWFGHRHNFFRVYPERLPPTRNYATDGLNITFSDYVDFDTEFHIITLNSNTRGLGAFRNIDNWGAVLAFQLSKALAPLITLWPDEYQTSFVRISDVHHKWFSPYRILDNVTSYVEKLIEGGKSDRILIVGDQFNGGYAKFLSASLGVKFIAFNPPGTKHTLAGYEINGTQIIGSRSIWSNVDSLEDTASTYLFPCAQSLSMTKCSRITTAINYLLEMCGDELDRSIAI